MGFDKRNLTTKSTKITKDFAKVALGSLRPDHPFVRALCPLWALWFILVVDRFDWIADNGF